MVGFPAGLETVFSTCGHGPGIDFEWKWAFENASGTLRRDALKFWTKADSGHWWAGLRCLIVRKLGNVRIFPNLQIA